MRTFLIMLTLTAFAHAETFDVDALRARGPQGLQHVIDAGAPADVIDAVAGQRHASVSKLYWYTDLDRAVAAATAQGKPIISLRLLGNLTDEFSCANSRYFRTTLYANQTVAALMRDRFVLHWQSVRPVPRITIDFGDGRKIERTITGNSIHWVLDPQGRPVDALPGLYASQTFMRQLDAAGAQALEPRDTLAAWHAERIAAMNGIPAEPTDAQWQQFAARFRNDVQFDQPVMELIGRQAPDAAQPMRLAVTKAAVESPMLRMVRRLGQSIAMDTAKNEYGFHRTIHQWFAAGDITDLAAANERVYATLFLTPSTDPWLGMAPADGFAALDGGGLRIMDN